MIWNWSAPIKPEAETKGRARRGAGQGRTVELNSIQNSDTVASHSSQSPSLHPLRRLRWLGTLLPLLLALQGCTNRSGSDFQWDPPDFRVKGTYYFQPRAAINNFWWSFDLGQCKRDFTRLREDGFNTIILMIPWGGFQTTVNPITYNERSFADLDRILNLAESFDLKVVLRVGSHERIPNDAGGHNWLAATLLTDDEEWAAYRDLFRELAARTKSYSNLLFYFWTFEDTGYTPDLWLHRYQENLQAFQEWLRRRPLWWWNLIWWEENSSYEAIEPPNQNSPPLKPMKLRSFLEFSDELLASRLADPCTATREGNPQAVVSFQPRAEINWEHDYSLQFELPPCYSFVTTWFSPYQSYLFGDKEKKLDGARTASYVPLHLERTEELSGGLPVFIDQFNFQHFGGHPNEGALSSENEQLEFIENALPTLLEDSLGYALWNYQDYYLNVITNGAFRLGLQEWERPPGNKLVQLKSLPSSHQDVAEIAPGGFLRQSMSVYAGKEYTLDVQARAADGPTRLHILIHFLGTNQFLDTSIPLGPVVKSFRLKVPVPKNSVQLTATFLPREAGQAAQLQEILFYPWIDTGGIYDVEDNPRPELRDIFRRLQGSALGAER